MKKVINQKHTYVRPAMQVYELSRKPSLLVGSLTGNRDIPYGNPIGY